MVHWQEMMTKTTAAEIAGSDRERLILREKAVTADGLGQSEIAAQNAEGVEALVADSRKVPRVRCGHCYCQSLKES